MSDLNGDWKENIWEKIKNDVDSTPTMVFSVIGDSNNFVPKPWAKTVFQTALIEAAKSGGESWIIHRGYDKGVSDVIREAYKKYGVMEFGTANGVMGVKHKERHVKLISIRENQEENQEEKNDSTQPLEHKETLAKGTNMLEFEKFVSKQEVTFFSTDMDVKMSVPIAIIACEGDIQTIQHISEAVKKTLPVIIVKGSGKAADLILDYLKNQDLLRKKASLLFGICFDDKTFSDLKTYLGTIKENEDLIEIFDADNDDPLMLSNIVGEAVVNCWTMTEVPTEMKCPENNQKEELQKTASLHPKLNANIMTGSSVAWKQIWRNSVKPKEEKITNLLKNYKDVYKGYVLNPKYASPTSLPLYFYFGYQLLQESGFLKKSGHVLLFEALKANRCDYVSVLLDQGVKFDPENLPELYDMTISCKDNTCKEEECLHIQWILKQINDDLAKKLCDEEKRKEVADAAKSICREILKYKDTEIKPNDNDKNKEHGDISDILLWAIFANRKEIAEICWLRGEDHLLTGLVCSAVLRKLAKKANNVKEQILSSEFEEHARLFEQRCIAIMDRMYDENTKHAINLMDDETVVWGITSSPLTFAYENFMYGVVAHTCSQKNMNKQWYNELAPDPGLFFKCCCRKPKKLLTAPVTKYVFNYIMFFIMLVMYSAFVLTSISTEYYIQGVARVFEYFVYIWGFGDFIEELISCFGYLESKGRSHRSYYSRMKRYLYDFWNVVDISSYIILIAALFVRHMYPSNTFTVARRMFSLSLLVMYLRFLEVFLIHRRLGPTLIMIKEMLKDLFRFLFVAVFIIIGVGIYYHANLWPDHQGMWGGDWKKWRIWQIIYYPHFQLYGELFNDFLEGKDLSDCSNITSVWQSDPSIERCPQEDWTVLAISALYMLFSNLVLVNLVIAMFSFTFERVQTNSEILWRFERYTVINDYDWRIPSPFNLAFLPYRCFNKCRDRIEKSRNKVKKREKSASINQVEPEKSTQDAKVYGDNSSPNQAESGKSMHGTEVCGESSSQNQATSFESRQETLECEESSSQKQAESGKPKHEVDMCGESSFQHVEKCGESTHEPEDFGENSRPEQAEKNQKKVEENQGNVKTDEDRENRGNINEDEDKTFRKEFQRITAFEIHNQL